MKLLMFAGLLLICSASCPQQHGHFACLAPKYQRQLFYSRTLERTVPICRRARQVQRAEAQWAAPFITPTAWQRACAAPFAEMQARIQIWCTAAAQESYSQSLLNQLTRSEQCSLFPDSVCSCVNCATQWCFSSPAGANTNLLLA